MFARKSSIIGKVTIECEKAWQLVSPGNSKAGRRRNHIVHAVHFHSFVYHINNRNAKSKCFCWGIFISTLLNLQESAELLQKQTNPPILVMYLTFVASDEPSRSNNT